METYKEILSLLTTSELRKECEAQIFNSTFSGNIPLDAEQKRKDCKEECKLRGQEEIFIGAESSLSYLLHTKKQP